jgi:hypothetical protein
MTSASAVREPSLKLTDREGLAGNSFPASGGGGSGLGESVRAVAGSPVPFGHLAGNETERYDESAIAGEQGDFGRVFKMG